MIRALAALLLTGCSVDLCGRQAECARAAQTIFSEPTCRDDDARTRSTAAKGGCAGLYDAVSTCATKLPCDAFADGGADIAAACPMINEFSACLAAANAAVLCGNEAVCARGNHTAFSEPTCRDEALSTRATAVTSGCAALYDTVTTCAAGLTCDALLDGGAQANCPTPFAGFSGCLAAADAGP